MRLIPAGRGTPPHRLIGAAALLVALALGMAGPASSSPPTALNVFVADGPKRVHGTDGREHIPYEFVVTNSFTAEATLKSLVVSGGGERLLTLRGDALAAAIRPFGGGGPTREIGVSSSVVVYPDVVMPRSAGRKVPKRITSHLSYALPEGAPVEALIGSDTVKTRLRVDRSKPLVIAPPLRGTGWASGNGCCGDLDVNHRSTILSANGTYVVPETFAVDYVRVEGDRIFSGDGTRNTDWFGYGASVRAATNGTVVKAINRRPDVPPFTSTDDNPTVNNASQFAGNGVVVRVRRGVFAHYYHFQPDSVLVKAGDRVRTGQKLGLFGNSGNTDGPHLHFGINASKDPLTSQSLPFEIDRSRLQGDVTGVPGPGEVTITGKPRDQRRAHPLVGSVSDYTR